MCITHEANIIWRSGHAIRSSFLQDFSFLHHSCRPVFTVLYVTAMQNDRFGRALYEDTFWQPNRTLSAQKNSQGEHTTR